MFLIVFVCKLLSGKKISMLSDKFLPSKPKRAVHSQKVAINIKITLLNNKYLNECGDIDLSEEPSNIQLQSVHTFQSCPNAVEETHWQTQHTLHNSLRYKPAQEQQTLCTVGSTSSRFLDLLAGIHDYSYFWILNKGNWALERPISFQLPTSSESILQKTA